MAFLTKVGDDKNPILGGNLHLNKHKIVCVSGPLILESGQNSIVMGGPINAYGSLTLNPTTSGARIVAKRDIVLEDNAILTTEYGQNLTLSPDDGVIVTTAPMIQFAEVITSPDQLTTLEGELLPHEIMFYIQNNTLNVAVKIPTTGTSYIMKTGVVIAELHDLVL